MLSFLRLSLPLEWFWHFLPQTFEEIRQITQDSS